jgi:hypothetical protein
MSQIELSHDSIDVDLKSGLGAKGEGSLDLCGERKMEILFTTFTVY